MATFLRRTFSVVSGILLVLSLASCGDGPSPVGNLPPEAFDATVTGFKNTPITVEVGGSDADGGSITVRLVSGPAHGTLSTISVGGSGRGTVTYTPNAGFAGTDQFVYEVSDGEATAQGTITIIIQNRVPTANAVAAGGTAGAPIRIDLSGQDADGDPLSFVIKGAPANGTTSNVTSTGPTSATVTYTSNAGFEGLEEFTYAASDGDGESAPAKVQVAVAPAVKANAQSLVTPEDQPLNIQLTADNPLGGAVTYSIVTAPEHGVVTTPVGSAVTYTPEADYFGLDAFTFEASDGVNAPSTAQVDVAVTSVNDDPSFAMGPDLTIDENAGAQSVPGWATNISAGPGELFGAGAAFSITPSDASFFAVQPALSLDGTLTFTMASTFAGGATVKVDLDDGDGGKAGGGVLTINVIGVNDVPSFKKGPDQTVAKNAGAQTVVGWATAISPGPADEAGQSVSFIVSNDNNPLFSAQPAVSPTGTLTFTPAPNAVGSATVTVAIKDNGGTANGGRDTSAGQTFIITVTGVGNTAPVATPQAVSTAEDTPLVITLAGSDLDGDPLTFAIATTPSAGALGAITQLTPTTAQVTYTPTIGQIGDRSFTFTANDGAATSAPATVTLTVIAIPVPVTVSGVGNTQIVTAGFAAAPATTAVTLANGVLASTPTLTIQNPGVAIATTAGGSVTLEADGDFLYTPKDGVTGVAADAFDYTVTTGRTATVTIDLTGMVWYVDNSVGGPGTGLSSDPFKTLAGASGASGAGDIVFVDRGDGTTTGMAAGVTLKANQELIGEPAGLTVGAFTLVAANGAAPRPQITNSGGDAITLGDASVVRSFDIVSPSGAGIASSLNNGGTIADVTLTTPGGAGLSLSAATGTFTVTGLAVSNAVGDGIEVDGGTATVAITLAAGGLDNAAGYAVRVENTTGGSVTVGGGPIDDTGMGILVQSNTGGSSTFASTTKNINTGANSAVQLLSNAGYTVSFTGGGLDIDATSGAGFTATGGGTVSVQGTGNSVTTTTGTAVNVASTTIGVGGLTFQSVSADGATNGIVLNATGGVGAFGVTGTGTTGGSGGTIQNTTGDAVSLTNASDVTLANMILGDATATAGQAPDVTNNIGGDGISLNTVDNLTLQNVFIARTGGDGIDGTGVTDVTFTDVTVLNAGDAAAEHGMAFDGVGVNNIDGTVVMDGVVIDGSSQNGLFVQNSSGVLDLTLQNCRIANTTGSASGDDGLAIDTRGSASATVIVDTCTFEDLDGDGIDAGAQELLGANLDLTVTSATFNGCAAGVCSATGSGDGFNVFTAGTATLDFDLQSSTLIGAEQHAVQINGFDNSTIRGTVGGAAGLGVAIGSNAVVGSGSRIRQGVFVGAAGSSTVTVDVSNNVIRHTEWQGIFGGSYSNADLNMTVLDNTVGTPDDNLPPTGVGSINVTSRGTSRVCTNIQRNVASAGTLGVAAIRVIQFTTTSTYSVERLAPGSQTAGTTQLHVQAENPASASWQALAATSFTGVADGSCPTPP